jgi:GT2 family glycosyltransferase
MGRNAMIQKVLEEEPDVTHLFFVDTDTVPPIDAIAKMLKLDQPFVSGMTPMISTKAHLWNVKHKGSDLWISRDKDVPDEPFEAEYVGGSCLLLRRDMLEKIGWPWFKTIFKKMQNDLVAKEKGEDMFICDRAREEGYSIWVHPEVRCAHYQYINLLTFLHE